MGLWRRLVSFLAGLWPAPADDADAELPSIPTPPLTHPADTAADGPHVTVTVYQTDGLTRRLGRTPERVVALYLAAAFEAAGEPYAIDFGRPPLDLPDPVDTLGTFADTVDDGARLHLLLGDRDGGGRAYRPGRYAVAPAGNIDRLVPVRERAPRRPDAPRQWVNLRAAALHEPGHAFRGQHADRMTDPAWDGYPENGARPSLRWHDPEDWLDTSAL